MEFCKGIGKAIGFGIILSTPPSFIKSEITLSISDLNPAEVKLWM